MDYQRQKVYDWELTYVRNRSNQMVSSENAQSIVDYVWQDMGLIGPPIVKIFYPKTSRKLSKAAHAEGREAIAIPPYGVSTYVILHEIAHCMTSTLEGNEELHGPDFVGMYVQLLAKYGNISMFELMYTLDIMKVDYNLAVKPYDL